MPWQSQRAIAGDVIRELDTRLRTAEREQFGNMILGKTRHLKNGQAAQSRAEIGQCLKQLLRRLLRRHQKLRTRLP